MDDEEFEFRIGEVGNCRISHHAIVTTPLGPLTFFVVEVRGLGWDVWVKEGRHHPDEKCLSASVVLEGKDSCEEAQKLAMEWYKSGAWISGLPDKTVEFFDG